MLHDFVVWHAVLSSIQINFPWQQKQKQNTKSTINTRVKYRSCIGLENPCWLLNK